MDANFGRLTFPGDVTEIAETDGVSRNLAALQIEPSGTLSQKHG